MKGPFERLESKGSHYLLHEGHIIDSDEPDYFKKAYERRASDLKFPKVLIFFGPRMGYELEKILKSEKEISFILLLDYSAELLRETLDSESMRVLLAPWLKGGRLSSRVVQNADEAFNVFYEWLRIPQRAFAMDAAWILVNPHTSKSQSSFAERLEDEWKAATKQIRRHFGGREDSLLGFHQTLQNQTLIESSPGVLSLKDQFRGVPAIIVSTGPSLSKSLEVLRLLKTKALLIAADASLPVLKRYGFEPHFVATIERDHVSKRFFEEGPFEAQLISYAFIPGSTIEAFDGARWLAYRDYGYFHFIEEILPRGIVSSSSSVSHFCMNLALYMGCSEVVLVGQDLAYDPETFQSHAAGVPFKEWTYESSLEQMKERVKAEGLGDVFFVPGNTSEQVPTHSTYFSFMKEFAWQASQSKVPVTNATQGGAKIPGLAWKALHDVSSSWPEVPDLSDKVKSLYSKAAKSGSLASLKNLIPFFRDIRVKLGEIRDLTGPLLSSAMVSSDKLAEVERGLRLAQTELMADPRFVAFVIQNAGMEFLDIENSRSRLEAKGASAIELLSESDRWNFWIQSVAEALENELMSI